nr:oxygenase MpaB family protein [uncultured Roseococcus sp.]
MTDLATRWPLLRPVQRRLDIAAGEMLRVPGRPAIDFSRPPGEPALVPADSMSWRVFKNPVTLFIGGVTAVLLELAEPRVRTGVWEHSSFRGDPVLRLRRTGLAAMVTVYGARSLAEPMIAGIVRRHEAVEGRTPAGQPYRANDLALLNWVQATASFGFIEAYRRYAFPLSHEEVDRFLAEAQPAARLYGALDAPGSMAEMEDLFDDMRGRLEPSPIVFEFLDILRRAPLLPGPLRPIQGALLRAAVELLPDGVRGLLGLGGRQGLRRWEAPVVRAAARLAEGLLLPASPAVQSCLRLGLPANYLYRPG